MVKRWFLNLPRPARSVVSLSLFWHWLYSRTSLVGIFRLAYDSVQSANLSKPKISRLLGYEASVINGRRVNYSAFYTREKSIRGY